MRLHTAHSKMTLCYIKHVFFFSNCLTYPFGLRIWMFRHATTVHKHDRIKCMQSGRGLGSLCSTHYAHLHHAALRFLALRVSGMQGTQPTSADPFELSSAVQPRSLSSNAEAMRKTHHRNNGLKSANGSERFFATQWHWQVKEAERVKPSQRHEGSTSVYLKGSVSMRFPSWQANSCISVYQCLSSFQLLCDLHFAELVPRGCLWLHADIWQHYGIIEHLHTFATFARICKISTFQQCLRDFLLLSWQLASYKHKGQCPGVSLWVASKSRNSGRKCCFAAKLKAPKLTNEKLSKPQRS